MATQIEKLDVLLIPGHGGKDRGASFGNIVEKTAVLIMSLAAEAELKRHGLRVDMTRRSDEYISPDDQWRKANAMRAKVNVAVHLNAGGGDGCEVIHSVKGGASKDLAEAIVDTLVSELKQNKRPNYVFSRTIPGTKTDYHAVVRGSYAPTVIVEGAFIDSKDREIVDTPTKQKAMGVAIAHGVLKHLGIKIKPKEKAKKKPASAKKKGWVYTRYLQVAKGSKVGVVANCQSVNIRPTPATAKKALKTVKVGSKLSVTGLTSGSWTEVTF